MRRSLPHCRGDFRHWGNRYAARHSKVSGGRSPPLQTGGHGGTYNEDNGGAFGAAVASLRWQLLNDTGGKAKGHFVGDPCGLCADANWKTDSRAMR
jgi:hypothetical protein